MTCADCGASSPEGAKFCFNCGARLEAPRPPEGERRFVTVLFADVVDSTAMGDVVDPETIAEIMNGAFSFFNASVARFGGTVARLMGDAVLAIFGAPVAHEDDAERAIHAGLSILSAAEQYAEGVQRRYGFDFRVRVGVNSGLAVLAMVGDDVKMEYTAMGDTANLASRLQNLADPGTLLVSAETHNLVRKLFESTSLGPVQVKGKSEPIEIFRITGIKAQPGSVRGLDGLKSPLVGRDDEMARAREAVGGHRGTGCVVIVSGEAGLGKSRLVAELRQWVSQIPEPPLWLEGRALSYGQSIAYYPWRQIVRLALGIGEGTPPSEAREKLSASVPSSDVAPLERLLSIEDEATAAQIDDQSGDVLVGRIVEAVERLLTSPESGRVLVLDDLHWADEPSLDLLRSVADLTVANGLVLILITRPERDARSVHILEQLREVHAGRLIEIDLTPLPDDAAETLLSNLLQVKHLPDSVRKQILDKSDGNPFFIEEVIRWLIDSGHVIQDGDGWRANGDKIETVAVPETLAGVLASRIDRLPPETKRVVQAAAVIGRIFEYEVLQKVCEGDRINNPEPHVRELTAEELVREKNPLVEYIFKHALTQEAAKDLLLLRRRREYHELVGRSLEQLYGDRLEQYSALLAYHFEEAEDWENAALYAHQAAMAALRVYAVRDAADQFSDEYDALNRLDSSSPERIIDAVTAWVEVGWKFLPYDLAVERLEHAERLARDLGDTLRLAFVLNWLGNAHASAGFPMRGVPAISEAFQLAEGAEDPRLTILPLFMMTSKLVDTDPKGAVPRLGEVYELAMSAGRPDVGAHALANKALAQARIGEFAEAEKTLAVALNTDVDVPVKKADVHSVASLVSLDMGQVDRGLEFARQAVDEAAGAGAGECTVYAMYCLGRGRLEQPDWAGARDVFNQSLERLQGLRSDYLSYLNRGGLAVAESVTDDPDAVAQLDLAREQAATFGDPYTAAQLSQTLAETHFRLGNLERADECLADALQYYRGNGMLPYLVRSVSLAVPLYRRLGREHDAADAGAELDDLTEQFNRALRERDALLAAV